MTETSWTIRALEFSNCNCSYGCPCQFNGLPTYGHCRAVVGFQIYSGHHGDTRLDGLKVAGMFIWPGAIHEGAAKRRSSSTSAPTMRNAMLFCAY